MKELNMQTLDLAMLKQLRQGIDDKILNLKFDESDKREKVEFIKDIYKSTMRSTSGEARIIESYEIYNSKIEVYFTDEYINILHTIYDI